MTVLAFLMVWTAYEMLWAMAKEEHPDLASRYRMVADVDPATVPGSPAYVKHYTTGSFDGDPTDDHAFVMVPTSGEGYSVLALLGRGRRSRVVTVTTGNLGRAGAVLLSVEEARTKSRRDILIVTPESGPALRYRWDPGTKSFRQVEPR